MRARLLPLLTVVAVATGCVTIIQRPPPNETTIPTPGSTSISVAIASPTAAPTPEPTTSPSAIPISTPTPPVATPTPTPSPTPMPDPTPTPELPDTEACRDDEYSLSGYHWDRPLEWRFDEETVPDRYDSDLVLEIIQRSFDNITGAFNDCNLPDRVEATATYRGTATGEVCQDADGVNLVAFGRLRGSLLAVTCPWVFDDASYAEIDIEIDRGTDWALSEECDFEYYLESVMTHEVGHAFGLGHVGERRHGQLTMSTSGPVCDNEETSLGLGDVLGLEELYAAH